MLKTRKVLGGLLILLCLWVIKSTYAAPLKEEISREPQLGIQAVIFDWAGTTVDYGSRAPVAAFKEVFLKHQVPITDQEAKFPMGLHKRAHIEKILEMDVLAPETQSVKTRWKQVHGHYPTSAEVDQIYAEFIPLQKKIISQYAQLIPGTLETVKYIRQQGWKIGSTTGYTQEMLDVVAKEAKKQGYEPDVNVTSDNVPQGRPSPDMIWLNCAKLKTTPSFVVNVDDTLPGIEAGRNAGVWTVMVLNTGNALGLSQEEAAKLTPAQLQLKTQNAKKQAENQAHFVITGIETLPPILAQIDNLIKTGHYPFSYPVAAKRNRTE